MIDYNSFDRGRIKELPQGVKGDRVCELCKEQRFIAYRDTDTGYLICLECKEASEWAVKQMRLVEGLK